MVLSRTVTAAKAGLLALAATAILAGGAGAVIDGPCTASIAGTNVKDLGATSASDAIKVKKDAVIPVSMSASKPIDHLKVTISVAGFSYDAKNGPASGTSWTRTVNVNDYAKWGVGLYQVTGSSSGPGLECSGAALVEVEGSPLSTPAGWAALALTVIGVIGLVLTALSAARGGGLVSRSLLGALAGLAAAIGVTALLQEYAVLYPTGTITVVALALGAIVGVGLPILMHALGGGGGSTASTSPPAAES
jgi:hypothetical protein